MPFKPTSGPSQIAAAQSEKRRASSGAEPSFSQGAAQQAKESAARWTSSTVRNPERDAAQPWFSGGQPFSEMRLANQRNFDDWKGRFINETDMGSMFVPPPPEPAPSAGPANPEVA